MWTIMSFLHQDLILYNWAPANLPVTIISCHSSVLLFIFSDHVVESGISCITCINAGKSIIGRPEFTFIIESSYK